MTEQAEFPQPQQPIPGLREPAPSSGKGCFFWGCLICVIVAVLFVGCVGFCLFIGYRQAIKYTATEPIEVPVYEAQPGETEEIQARVDSFLEEAEDAPESLELTADDLNALVARNEDIPGGIYFRIEDDVLRADVSIPLDPIPFLSGRYFNGELAVRPRVVNGQPAFDVESAKVGAEEIEPEAVSVFLNRVVTDVMRDPDANLGEMRKFLEQVESLEVRDGKLVIER